MKKIVAVAIFALLISSLSFAISFSYQDTDLANALRDISQRFETPIAVSNEVSGWVNISFEADNIVDALKTVLLGTNYTFAKLEDIYLVGSINSPDKTHATLFKSRIVFLKDTYPSTVYNLLGSLSKYVVYSPNSMIMVVDADDETSEKIMKMISKIDVPNSNRFFSYEIHEMTTDEYQRFRQFERYNKSGILTLSDVTFDIFKEIISINGDSDTFGTVALPMVGSLKINSSNPSLVIDVASNENTVGVTVKTVGNAMAFEMNPSKNHAVVSMKEGNKRFLVLASVAKTPKESEIFPKEEKKQINYLTFAGESNPTTAKYSGTITYGSTDALIIVEGNFGSDSTPTIGVGLKANLIDEMYGIVELRLRNGQPVVYGKIGDTTHVGIFSFKASLNEEWTLGGFNPLEVSVGTGFSIWNLEIFGGLMGEWDALQPYFKANLTYEWIYGSVQWKQTEDYTFGLGVVLPW